ncbi:conserved hypothetical protein [Ricinus communis]|uniref:Uncharacterized protein n=1 Tax=Ricinus communis TaxID=3988 RepID=B9SII1_RICCO|nr:conserved hypothetical protein [Ricinus communis]
MEDEGADQLAVVAHAPSDAIIGGRDKRNPDSIKSAGVHMSEGARVTSSILGMQGFQMMAGKRPVGGIMICERGTGGSSLIILQGG